MWGPIRIDAERSRRPWKRMSRDALDEALDTLGLDKPSDKSRTLAENDAVERKS